MTLQEANNLLHEGINKNSPEMVKQAFKNGAQTISNSSYSPSSPLVAATQKLITTAHEYDKLPCHKFFYNLCVFAGLLELGSTILSNTNAIQRLPINPYIKTVGIAALAASVPLLIRKLEDFNAKIKFNRHKEIIDQILAHESLNTFTLITRRDINCTTRELGKEKKRIEKTAFIKSLEQLDFAQNIFEHRQEILNARERIHQHYTRAFDSIIVDNT